jgi:hypothetical protein
MNDLGSTVAVAVPAAPREAGSRQDDDVTLSTAELADCTCPDFCERDHDTD